MKPKETIDFHIKSAWLGIANLYNQIAQKHELTQATGFVLLNIDENEGAAATKIAPIMGMRNTSLSRILKKMENEGLIIRRPDENDRRSVKIHLTKRGKIKKQVAKEVVIEYNEHLINSINKKDLDAFFYVMEKICGLTEEYRNKKMSQ